MNVTGLALCAFIAIAFITISWADEARPVVVLAPEFEKLIPKDAKVEKVAGGFEFLEGPVWHKDGYLLFSDCHQVGIYKWDPATGKTSLYREVPGNSNGLTFDNEGRLIAVEYGMHRLTREEKDGKITVLVSEYQGKRLNTTNDVVVRSDGSIYFTDPPYGVKKEDRELDFQGVYRLSPEGKLTLLVKDFDCPNGLAFSPDEKTLYIADSSARMHIRAFDVKEDGTLANGRLFTVLKSRDPGCPDGLKVDTKGNVWTTGPGGIWVFDRSGKHLGIIKTPEVPANCAWGDSDGKTLYITARTSLYRFRTKVEGNRPWMKGRQNNKSNLK
ncbi:MAG: SMP-30/gluconolactonase/LRE family protein [Armatimonadetes bacterium]|nr:SMP-30/gluconolactonase/LRE family protein [Armatimonadota bacterium]